ncbi:MAG: VWA domain-containing protein [Methanosarcina sp.]
MQELKNWKENFEDTSGSGSALPFDHAFNPSTILNVELREVLATPRTMPRQLREEIAGILIYELFSGKEYEIKDEKLFMGKFGVFYPIFLNIRNLEGWTEIKTLAGTNSMAGVFILRTLLDELFSLIDDCEKIESDFSKKFPKNLEKTLTSLKKLINETYAIWEKKRLQAWEEKGLQGMKENSERQEKPDAAWEKQRTEEKNQENYLKNQENFLKDPDYEIRENPDQQSEKMAGSEKLASMTREFMFSEKAGEILDSTVGEKIAAKIGELIPILEENLEMLEILSMLFPGRMWDYSLRSLHREYFGNLEKYAAVLRKNSDLREIIELVGRIELEYGSKKLNLSPYSKSEVHTVTFSGDIQTLLPIEAVKLKNPILKLKFYADMLEGKLLTYQLRGKNWNSDAAGKKRKGPVIALVDTSASMRGSPEITAKAVLLAITKRMLKEGRDVKVILFSSKWQTFEIELTDKKRMGQEFLEFLKYTFGGGTDFNTALHAGLKTMKGEKAFEGADILFLTDGVSELSEIPLIREWKEIKTERKARIFSLIIGNSDAGGLEQVSDHIYIIRDAGNWEVRESPASFVKAISRIVRF